MFNLEEGSMRLSTAAAFMILGGSIYSLWRALAPVQATMAPEVRRRLPLAKNLNTIDDRQGNYDMDGVSFDTSGVVVSGDAHKIHHVTPPGPTLAGTSVGTVKPLH
jgi:hypothetical protein